ncbi:Type III restriction enzyme, res subunit [Caulifigura coniformis]|uniref:Type III restriction enzyme, res subunit n=1 Tax=Caulifigura coniformis TaxID=2527983 RepID=A0A517SCN3_9PLAN|nr:DEAD/DEAH box helicase family protein [Caulifigura coniformis]QDT53892.1 Type III restriction enzyme, res subunit [Caulifigura coniformis]
MKLQFKKQGYQTAAVESVADCFAGQPKSAGIKYRIDPGRTKDARQITMKEVDEIEGFKNSDLAIPPQQVLQNIQAVQRRQNLPESSALARTNVSPINLDVEMETGTGKTYCYIKTMFELHERFGWGKFIVVVPSIAIREGVKKSFEITAEHFLETYGKRARVFIYNSKSLHEIESFSSDAGINVMIINVQAFNATGKDNRRIYEELDDFQSRKPIDVIQANRPILILDEPQKMEGKKTVDSLAKFNPLMILRYSATHKTEHNKIHRLDALDAYNQKLVKKIAVRGISVKGLRGTNAYLYLESIQISTNKPPEARLELETKQAGGIKRVVRKIGRNDNLFDLSGGLDQYKGFVVADIDALKDTLSFTNGEELQAGDATGDVNEAALRRIQVREAIRAHFEKEQVLFHQGIKVLTLFFIDEVAKYRQYDDNGEQPGEYAKIFEEEYEAQLQETLTLFGDEYDRYLKGIPTAKTHNGYFSIDKKTSRLVDPATKKTGELKGETEDVDAYDLILKDKERLLSFEEPVRFIFSHSALREGWDNPNVFVICALKHSDNTISRRQEVGRGMRLSVNQRGDRMDDLATVHQINVLTVVASESYKEFVGALQKDISESLSARPRKADEEFFTGKVLKTPTGDVAVTPQMAKQLYKYLLKNDYTDDGDRITQLYHDAKKNEELAPLPPDLAPHAAQVFSLIDSVFSEAQLPEIGDDRKDKPNPLSSNFHKKEFQELWSRINRKAAYTVHFETPELIRKCVVTLDKELNVAPLQYTIQRGEQADETTFESLQEGEAFELKETASGSLKASVHSAVKYDLIGKLAEETKLTRRTIAEILQGVTKATFGQYRINPEDFLQKAARLINEQKATVIVEHLTYDMIDERHDSDIFTREKLKEDFSKAIKADRHIYDYVFTDSKNEREFVRELDTSVEVVVYAKLPKSFTIPTPVGHYNPDWAIAFQEGVVKHVYFIAETKGSMSSMELRKIEECKIDCARKFFRKITSDQVKYDVVNSYGKLMELVK